MSNTSGWPTWLWFLSIFTIWPWLLSRLHYRLPDPLPPYGLLHHPQVSEPLILSHVAALENIGYRTVGTPQARQGEDYVIQEVRKLDSACEDAGELECQVWIQTGSGFHSFSMLDYDVLKVYVGVRNVVLRIRSKIPPSGRRPEQDAILLGAHIDSALPAPGAADDAIGVGIMLDIARVLIERNKAFDNSVLFLWNGAEETFQDGSHLYSTQHETAKSVKAVINLEAAGSTGGALVFQATSKEMIDAFSKMPYPRGTVLAADVFASGIMISDTDFVQFEKYLNVSGLDVALVGHSYFYHTQKDSLRFIERGSAQHFADNVFFAVDYLISPASPLLKDESWSPPDMVYFSLYDRFFFKWSMQSALPAYMVLASAVTVFTISSIDWNRPKVMVLAVIGTPLGLIAGLLSANLVAAAMTVIDRTKSWFKHEHLCLAIYAPATLLGISASQFLLAKWLSPLDRPKLERATYYSQMLWYAWAMLALQTVHIRSAYLFAVLLGVLLIGATGNALAGDRNKSRMDLTWSYGTTLPVFMFLGVEAITTVLDIFVPLTGRMGTVAPGEIIVASISASLVTVFWPVCAPLFHRLSPRIQRQLLLVLLLATFSMMAIFAGPYANGYDSMHPKRTAIQYIYNHTDHQHALHVALIDNGPSLDFPPACHERYASPGSALEKVIWEPHFTDWDVLYPVSSLLDPYRIVLPSVDFEWPLMRHELVDLGHDQGIRRFQIRFDFTGLVMPTVAFDAEIVDWSFDFAPPMGHKRHYMKIAAGYDVPHVDLELAIRTEAGGLLKMDWSGIDMKQMVPGTASTMGPEMPASKLLLDLDSWAKERWQDSLDTLTFGTVTGCIEL